MISTKKDFKYLLNCYIIYKILDLKGVNKMRLFTKRFTSLTMTLILGLTFIACGGTTTTSPSQNLIPKISNPEDIFYSTENFDITYGDLYDSVKINDGLNQLLAMVDADLLSDYLAAVTQSQIDKKVLKLKFGTDDEDEIAKMPEDQIEYMLQNFADTLFLMGFSNDNYEEYVRLVLAREHYVIELMTSEETANETWHVGPEKIAVYYDQAFENDIQSIKIKFNSEADARNVMREFNLITRNGQLMLYTGTRPIAEVPSFDFNDSNTRALTDEEVKAVFIDMYNLVYGDYRQEIGQDLTFEELVSLEDLNLVYDDLMTFNSGLARFIYFTLGNLEDFISGESTKPYYTYRPEKYFSGRDTAYYMVLNLTGPDKADVKDFEGSREDLIELIGEDIYLRFEQELIDINMSSQTFVSRRLASLRRANEFVIYDYYMNVDYKAVDSQYTATNTGDLSKIATYNDKVITADDLFTYALNQNAAMYLIYASQVKAVIAKHFESVYCWNTQTCIYDYTDNESAEMLQHKNEFNQMKTQFSQSMYATYYTFDEYLYLAYGVKNMEDMLHNYYIKATLQPVYIFDYIYENNYEILNDLLDMIQPYYDNYFSLVTTHLLIYLDRNEDGTPDNFEEFYNDLENPEDFDQILEAFELAIRNYLQNENNTFASLVTEYKSASRNHETWGQFKRYGFFLLTENLSPQEPLTYANTINKYEDSFVDALIELYQVYRQTENLDKTFLYKENLIETSYGLHLIRGAKGTGFEMPSAVFEMTYNDDNQPNFTVGVENDMIYISFDQLKIYTQYRFTQIIFGSLSPKDTFGFERPSIPTSVSSAMKAFAESIHDAVYVVGFLNIGIIEELNAGDFVNAHSSYYSFTATDLESQLTRISEIYLRQVFMEVDVR